jgi:hypothetical protein
MSSEAQEIIQNNFEKGYGRKFCITGQFPYDRSAIVDSFVKRGFVLEGHVTKDTVFIVVGTNPGSYYEAAKVKGVKMLFADDLDSSLPQTNFMRSMLALKGLTQEKLAKIAGVPLRFVEEAVKNNCIQRTIQGLCIAKALGVPFDKNHALKRGPMAV